ncbi:ABC transporter permease subunit [Deinococcus ruber]|uniref:ABC transporter permease n=1 Tax=Deinococcus ruber TaxID=1848197 RepID=A0A918FJP5_9DEIO|nr:ABC transporter permease subunit [Deinococcus ruber]GGR39510.1 hypothetical protein GCM10008957_55400 [Deinococcus ruber]
MWPEVLRQTLRDGRRGWLWWAGSLLAYTVLVLAFYPTVKNDPAISDIMKRLPESVRALFGTDLSTPAGYIGGRLFSLMPLLLSVFAGLTGSALIAGEEARGHLEFPLTHPLSRAALLLGRLLALLVMLAGLGVVLFAGTWLLGQVFQAPLPVGRVLETAALHTGGAWVFGALAFSIGAATGRAGLASGLGVGLGVALVVVHLLSAQVAALRNLAWLNPWTYALGDAPLTQAVAVTPLIVCLLVGFGCLSVVTPLFGRRDIGR